MTKAAEKSTRCKVHPREKFVDQVRGTTIVTHCGECGVWIGNRPGTKAADWAKVMREAKGQRE